MFWILTAAMVLLVAAAMLRPFLGNRTTTAEPPAAYDLRVYQDQLREVDRDVARKVLSAEEADRLRTEIGRKVLEADRALSRQSTPQGRSPRPFVAALLMLALIGGSAALYWRLGAPTLPDMPLKSRIAAADERLANRPAQAEAEKAVPPRPVPESAPDYVELVEQLRTAVAKRPDDPQGLALLAEHEARLGNLSAAREAQAKLVAAKGDQADALDYARLAGLMIEAAGGTVSREASAALDSALKLDPKNGQSLYLKGLMLAQNDRPDLAFPIWRELIETGRPDDPWMLPIQQLIPDLAWLAGHPNYQLPEIATTNSAAPDDAAIAAADALPPEQRQQAMTDIARQIEGQLAEHGGTPAEWARLITALVGSGNEPHAKDIWAEAQTRFGDKPEALAIVTAAAAKVGLTSQSPATTALPGPDADAVAAAEQMTDAERQQMIAGMVSGLEERLATQGGSGAEWARLIGALTVMGDKDKAQAQLAKGREALADDAEGLAALNEAASRAGLE